MAELKLLEICSAELGHFSRDEFFAVLGEIGPDDDIDKTDKGGMTSLMHCAYRGNTEGCVELLRRGAKINLKQEADGYTPLMFATIAGRTDIVLMMLERGASTSIENKIGKTAAQLGSFVGQHDCVQVINNYFSLSDLMEYTTRTKADGQPRLDNTIAQYLHKLLVSTRIHPVHVVLCISAEPAFLGSKKDICHVLDKVSADMMANEKEGFSLKAHYIGFLLGLCVGEGAVERLLKKLLLVNERGVAVEMDLVLRQCLREFPHHHSVLLKQLVGTLAEVEPGAPPTALTLFTSAIVGEKTVAEGEKEETCATCGLVSDTLKKCSNCKKVYYCGVDCQKLAWSTGNHRKLCKKWIQSNES